MTSRSRNPLVTTSAALAPLRVRNAFVPIVNPCTKRSMSPGATPAAVVRRRMPSAMPSADPVACEVTLSRCSRPAPVAGSTSISTRSVNVPPTSAARQRMMGSDRPPRLEGGGQCAVIEIVELAADGHAVGEARDRDIEAGEAFGDVVRRRLAVDGGAGREDHFLDAGIARAAHEPGNAQLVRPDAV